MEKIIINVANLLFNDEIESAKIHTRCAYYSFNSTEPKKDSEPFNKIFEKWIVKYLQNELKTKIDVLTNVMIGEPSNCRRDNFDLKIDIVACVELNDKVQLRIKQKLSEIKLINF